MTDAAVVGRLLREYRNGGLDPSCVRRRYGSVSGTRVGYQLRQPDGSTVLVHAYREDMPLPAQFHGSGTTSVADWLSGRAATLEWLAARGYPGPRVVVTRTDEPVGLAGPWLTWATTFVRGRAMGRAELGLLGGALGRLHALAVPPAEAAPPEAAPRAAGMAAGRGVGPGLASWHPAAIPAALSRLTAVTTLLPGEWRPLHEQFHRTLLAVRRASADLPLAVVHGDVWPGNAVVTADGVTFIDWEYGGLGLPVVDLGNCLLECHLDPGPPPHDLSAWDIQPDARRVADVVGGYTRQRSLCDAEREILPEAIRFVPACAGAIHFERALIEGVHTAAMDARLALLRNRIAVSQAVADLAARHLGPPRSRYAEPGRSEATGA
jgi:Ser/Thr protein kinase RdoA (MazF antagonist)